MMRHEADIRREVEGRIRRRGLLLLHLLLWAVISLSLFLYSRIQWVPAGWIASAAMTMAIWLLIVGLHGFWVGYVEVRDRAVRSAIERERQFYLLRDHYEKSKRSEEHARSDERERVTADSFRMTDDGELIDYPDKQRVKVDYER